MAEGDGNVLTMQARVCGTCFGGDDISGPETGQKLLSRSLLSTSSIKSTWYCRVAGGLLTSLATCNLLFKLRAARYRLQIIMPVRAAKWTVGTEQAIDATSVT